jgi:pimeloyl-ACP methyl ester carboxylesterase
MSARPEEPPHPRSSGAPPKPVPAPLPAPEGRAFATQAIAAGRRIATPEGIDRLEQVDVGGDRQWISIRGRNRANPVLLVVHGGPGTPTMPLAWAFQNTWEDFFTVVHWEQRGVGKNDATADRQALLPTLSLAQIVLDGEAVIDYLCHTLGKARVAILGFSWGAIVGARLAERAPGKVSVYAGVGQAVAAAFEPMILAETLAAAERAGDEQAVRELRALDLSPGPDGRFPLAQVQALRAVARRYDGMWYGHESLQVMNDLAALAPEYDERDVAAFQAGAGWIAQGPLAQDLATMDLRTLQALQVPVVVLQGRYDLATPHAAAAAWLAALQAPAKALVTFERSAHFPMFEEPGRFLQALLQHVLPHTEGSPDFVPLPR